VATWKEFEDIDAWQRARALTARIYKIINATPTLRRDFFLADQLRRSSNSIMSNIAEGFDRGGRDEFLHFLSIAKASAAECRSHLYVAHDAGYIANDEFDALRSLARECSAMTNGVMSYLRNSPIRGAKFKRDA
jgi:four helix bundle protein